MMFKLKNDQFRNLKTNLLKLKKEIQSIEIKIETQDLEGHYSINSDILDYAHEAYVSMKILGYIKNFEEIG